jgi:hypothetical protein
MAYDAANEEVVLFGGAPGPGGEADDTWVWTGTTWVDRSPASHPAQRTGPAMAFDEHLGAVVLFGGGNDENIDYDDTWTWNGTSWSRLPTTRSPRPRTHMASDAVNGRLLIFGGVRALLVYLYDTWVFEA